jgi:hypothetical protein
LHKRALDHPAQEVALIGVPLSKDEIRFQGQLSPLPNLLGDDGGDLASDDLCRFLFLLRFPHSCRSMYVLLTSRFRTRHERQIPEVRLFHLPLTIRRSSRRGREDVSQALDISREAPLLGGLAKRGVIPREQFYIKLFFYNTVILLSQR